MTGYGGVSDLQPRLRRASITTWSSRETSESRCKSWRLPRSCQRDEDPGRNRGRDLRRDRPLRTGIQRPGPKDNPPFLLGDFIVVRLQDLLTPAEKHLAKSPSDKARDLLKQVRSHLIETAKPLIQAMVQEITGVKVVSLHHDISTVTGAFVILTLAEPPPYRQAKKI